MNNKSDPRTTNLFLMQCPLPTLMLCIGYFYIVKILGPKFMEARKPFKVTKLLIIYNFLQTIWSCYLFWEIGMAGWFGRYNWRCEPFDPSNDEYAVRMARAFYLFYLSKFFEFFDTFFFILRKRFDLISMLHIAHHGTVPFTLWWCVKFLPGGHQTIFGFFNSFVHIFMYLYYMLAAMGPKMRKYLWWKKYLTILQMTQFVVVLAHSLQLFFQNPCNFPMIGVYNSCFQAGLFLCLFLNYYFQEYSRKLK
ncbi:hypothetical protein ACKWTF_015193 [Chironomus riparius]